MRRKLAAGNWKMNGLAADLAELDAMKPAAATRQTDVLICTPATLISRAAEAVSGSAIAIGGQDCHVNASGAHTGDISAAMLADSGAGYVITGHSERRVDHGETDAVIAAKSEAGYANDLIAVICIGESLEEREGGQTLDVVGTQLKNSTPDAATGANTVIAYEPVWAIGTGKVPTLEQIAEVHDFIRAKLVERFGEDGNAFRVLYGGSVKPSNAQDIFAVSNVDGALVGGASLKASDFNAIIEALDAA
ncbi:triose-phosphate isomerase [Cognatishimia maritima]|uniref:Triosephosphate isomerase n=1 Tax=Cognatishimia maritima TaxID=870908 RepID=A0A1M5J111_9RHOB|nr:triose-phosphate isomerase [Cognatishimia maritima]SHG34246.1 triosephosphate isomerase [Cognatishimia maritima]